MLSIDRDMFVTWCLGLAAPLPEHLRHIRYTFVLPPLPTPVPSLLLTRGLSPCRDWSIPLQAAHAAEHEWRLSRSSLSFRVVSCRFFLHPSVFLFLCHIPSPAIPSAEWPRVSLLLPASLPFPLLHLSSSRLRPSQPG